MNKKSMTLQAWSRQWLELYVKPVAKPSGYEHYRDNLEKYILPLPGPLLPGAADHPRWCRRF